MMTNATTLSSKQVWLFLCRGLAFLLLATMTGGCLVPRKHSALPASAQPHDRVALLPVQECAVTDKAGVTEEELRRLGNEVLDTLAKAEAGKLVGPAAVVSVLGTNGLPPWSSGEVGQRIDPDAEAVSAARRVANSLGVRQAVRCRLSLSRWSGGLQADGGGIGGSTTYSVVAKLGLIELDPLALRRTVESSGAAEQTKGLFLLMVPVYYGTTLGRAVDHAERAGLTKLFEEEHADPKP